MPQFRLQAGSLTKASERARRRARRILRPALRRMAAIAAQTIEGQLSEEKVAKATRKEDVVVDEVMHALYAEFASLAEALKRPFTEAALSGVREASLQVEFADAGNMLSSSNEAARAWAERRAAELVGMKWVNGKLVENPNPKWAITDTIRTELRDIVEDAFMKETPLDVIIQDVQESGSFSESRAEMIARTEVSRAQIQGNWELWDESGQVKTYDWLLSEDEDVCAICEAIAANGPYEFGEGPVPIEDSHPHCRCVLVAGIIETESQEPKAAMLKYSEDQPRDEQGQWTDGLGELSQKVASEEGFLQTFNKEHFNMAPETNAEKATVDAGRFFLTLPITKFDEEQRIVEGIATAEVLDSQGDIVDFAAACDAFKNWEGNIREQHDPKKAVGRAVEWTPDEGQKAIRLTARISKGAQDTWEKVKDGTLKYFSIGSPFGGFERKPEVVKSGGEERKVSRLLLKQLSEVSLVDQGACPAAKIELVKSDGARSDSLAEDETEVAKPETPPHEQAAEPALKFSIDDKGHSVFMKSIDFKSDVAKAELPWVPMGEWDSASSKYVPHTFGENWESIELAQKLPDMLDMLKRTLENIILTGDVDNIMKRELCQDSLDEFFSEIDEELSEAKTAGTAQPALQKAGARNNRADMKRIQGMHDSAVELGAVCKMQKSTTESLAEIQKACEDLGKSVERYVSLLKVADQSPGLNLYVMTQDQIEKFSAGAPLDKVMEAATGKILEVRNELETKMADQSTALAKEHDELKGEVKDIKADLELVKKEPASLPIVKAQRAEKILQGQGGDAGEDPDAAALVDLNKRYDLESDQTLKSQLGQQIAMLEIKVSRRKAAMR